ncbi:MAG: aromatic ring-hydroxylating dioxygenase subunit alpha [Gammaproteobacteria bacterium]|nr:aromatic ring-hydroxylating dioxygenase subunit alpha [Gammaproteobacteria bacterium]
MNETTIPDTDTISALIENQQRGWSLDQRFYTDPGIYALELERIITRNWILAGHVSQLPETGDFKVLKVANESAIIVRSQDGSIKAFANVCRHRGSLVCLEGEGNTRKFECPYHGWIYDTDGHLIAARSMPDDFDKKAYALHKVSVEVLHGLLFICFSESPPSLAGARKDLAEPMAMFDFEHLKVAAQKNYQIDANWKLAVENYQECYHCATAHPEYAVRHTLMLDPKKRPRVQVRMLEKMQACGLKEINIDHIDTQARPGEQGYGYSRTALFEGCQTGSEDGQSLAPLLGKLTDYDGGASDFTLGPFSFLLAYSDHVVGYVFTPIDKDRCQCEIYWFVRSDAVEGRDYNVDRLTWLWDVTTQADKEIIINNWKGVQSKYYQPGPFSAMERAESLYIEWILQALRREA